MKGERFLKKMNEEGLGEAAEQQDRRPFSSGPRLTHLLVYIQPDPAHNTHIVCCAKESKQHSPPQGAV